ncbi:MAG: hypothetical protein ACYCX4_06450 [Bacillota bacterium]
MQTFQKSSGRVPEEIQNQINFYLYFLGQKSWLQVAVRDPVDYDYMLNNSIKLQGTPPLTFNLLDKAIETPEELTAQYWPEMEELYIGFIPELEKNVTWAAACNWPSTPDELRQHFAMLRDAFDLWLGYPPKVSEWLPRDAADYLMRLKPLERFLATSPESLIHGEPPKETGCADFLNAFPEASYWYKIRNSFRDWFFYTTQEPWPELPSPSPTIPGRLLDYIRHSANGLMVERYNSPFIVSLAWAELIHYARVNAKGRYCEVCGQRFIVAFRQWGKQFHCSVKCRKQATSEKTREYNSSYYKSHQGKITSAGFGKRAKKKP